MLFCQSSTSFCNITDLPLAGAFDDDLHFAAGFGVVSASGDGWAVVSDSTVG